MTIHRHNLSSLQLHSMPLCSESTTNSSSSTQTPSAPAYSRTQSCSSIASLPSSIYSYPVTPEFSTNVIQSEIGNLFHINNDNDIDDFDLEAIVDDEEIMSIPFRTKSSSLSLRKLASHNSSKINCLKSQDATPTPTPAPAPIPTMEFEDDTDDACMMMESNSETEREQDLNDSLESYGEEHAIPETVPKKSKSKWFICLIGLPACGKSTVVKQLATYIKEETNDLYRIKSFNAGDVRRKHEKMMTGFKTKFDFNFGNDDSTKLRNLYAFEALKQLTDSLINDSIDIGVFDATNSTVSRRESVFKNVSQVSIESGVKIHPLILEVKCKNNSMRRFNMEHKAHNNDYRDTPKDIALADFFERARKYENAYERVTTEELSHLHAKYFSITNAGESIHYDCGLTHSSQGHPCGKFKSTVLNLILSFLISYRSTFGKDYIDKVVEFYESGVYKPIAGSAASSTESSTINSMASSSNNSSTNLCFALSNKSVNVSEAVKKVRLAKANTELKNTARLNDKLSYDGIYMNPL